MHVAMIGCGYIADLYVRTMRAYPSLQLIGVADRDSERVNRFSAFHDVPAYRTVDDLLGDKRVEVALNLTNPRSHYGVSRSCLLAGKHVYSEKPLAMDLAEARELVELAAARELRISAAPCSLLGECAQTMWKALRQKKIGQVLAAYAEMDDGLVHRMPYGRWFSRTGVPWPFRDEFEVGCTMEHAGYSLSWLLAFFGPALSVTAFSSLQVPDKHRSIDPEDLAPDFSVATIRFESGVVARLTCSVIAPCDHSLRIIGEEGVLSTPDVWHYASPVYSRRLFNVRRRSMLSPWKKRHPRLAERGRRAVPDDRSRGIAELVAALGEGRPSRLSAEFSLHVTELALAIQRAGTQSGAYRLTTTFGPIAPMPWAE